MDSDTLEIRCPDCKGVVFHPPRMVAATTVHRRKCPKCSERWSLVIRPLRSTPGVSHIHKVEWTRLTTAT